MRIGIDVGGTHTDAVLFDGKTLLASHKSLTSDDIASGVIAAVREILQQSAISASAITMVVLGTTQFTNAVVQRRGLERVGALRIGAQSSAALAIGAKWPVDIAQSVIEARYMVDGGHDFDGQQIKPLDERGVEEAAHMFAQKQCQAIAVTGVFSTSNGQAEKRAAEIIRHHNPKTFLALSSDLGDIGLYQRENATLLNASLMPLADHTIGSFERAFIDLELACPFFISQNDGTLMSADRARHYPVFTFSSGPTNSMRGATWLAGEANAMVVDVGGTTSDIGMLIDGYPRPSGAAVKIGGVLTNFRMPDVMALGLGGGSLIEQDGSIIGPRSVGKDLPKDARIFGGGVLTASDIAVAAGLVNFGERARVADIPPETIKTTQKTIHRMLSRTVDQMKTSPAPLPLIVVGGGGFLVPDNVEGVSHVIRPENGGVANAIGAAFAQVSGVAEKMVHFRTHDRDDALAAVRKEAMEMAVRQGAVRASVSIVDIKEEMLTYTDEPGAIIRARAVGDIDLTSFAHIGAQH